VDKTTFDRIWDSTPFIHQDDQELWWLVQKVTGLAPKKILEVGSAHGGTLLFWQELASEKVVSVCDVPLDGGISYDAFDKVEFIIGDSHALATRIAANAWGPFDFVFIDGDHTQAGVQADWIDYSRSVRKGGIVAFHDVSYGTVRDPDSEIKAGKVFESIAGYRKERIDVVHGIGVVWT